jgi:hypothetical protein
MKKNLLRASVFLVLALSINARAVVLYAPIPGVFSTGVDRNGNPLPAGTVDPHYSITASPEGAISAMVTAPNSWWIPGTSSSAWINDNGAAENSPAGDFFTR